MNALGTLSASVILDAAGFIEGTEKTKHAAAAMATNVDRAVRDLENSVKGAMVGIAAAFAAGFGVKALSDAFDNLVRTRAELERMSATTGASVQGLSILSQAAKLAGVDIGTIEMAAIKMTKGLAGAQADTKDAGKALEYLGVSARDSYGQLRDPSDVMRDVAKSLGGIEDGANKTALATALWGKGGAAMLPVMRELAQNGDLVAKVTAEQAAQARAYEIALVRGQMAMSATKNIILGEMIPPATALVETFTKMMTASDGAAASMKALAGNGEIRTWADQIGYGLARAVDMAIAAKNAVLAIGSSFIVVGADVAYGASKMAGAVLGPFGILLEGVAKQWRDAQLEEANKRWGDLLESNTRKTRDLYVEQLKLNDLLSQGGGRQVRRPGLARGGARPARPIPHRRRWRRIEGRRLSRRVGSAADGDHAADRCHGSRDLSLPA
jgi:hypothetical protein